MDIRELAIRAGFEVLETGNESVLVSDPGSDAIVRFAALVQAAERERLAQLFDMPATMHGEAEDWCREVAARIRVA